MVYYTVTVLPRTCSLSVMFERGGRGASAYIEKPHEKIRIIADLITPPHHRGLLKSLGDAEGQENLFDVEMIRLEM